MSCSGDCKDCNKEHDAFLKEYVKRPLEEDIFELKADLEARLTEQGIMFSQGTSALTFGEIEDTPTNRAKVALDWIGMMIAMAFPSKCEQGHEPL